MLPDNNFSVLSLSLDHWEALSKSCLSEEVTRAEPLARGCRYISIGFTVWNIFLFCEYNLAYSIIICCRTKTKYPFFLQKKNFGPEKHCGAHIILIKVSQFTDTKRKKYPPSARFYLHIDSPFKRSYCYWITVFFKIPLWNTFCWIYLHYEFSSLQTAHSWKLWTLNKLEYYSKVKGRFKYQICAGVYWNIFNEYPGHNKLQLFCTILNEKPQLSKKNSLIKRLIYFIHCPSISLRTSDNLHMEHNITSKCKSSYN